MGNKYNEQDINRFFENLKNLKNTYDLEKVHRLINNPDAKATQKVKFYYKPLNFIIMTSIIMILVSAVLSWLNSEKTDEISKTEYNHFLLESNVELALDIIDSNQNKQDVTVLNEKIRKQDEGSIKLQLPDINLIDVENHLKENIIEDSVKIYYWPMDTVIDKNDMILYLTNQELERLGVYNRNDSMKYKNVTPDGKYQLSRSFLWADYGGKWPYTILPFYMIDLTDTINTDYNKNLFEKYDTLIPIQTIITNKPFILWFTPHTAIFDSLPKRYKYIGELYDNLRYVKKMNPNHQIVNYWKKVEVFKLEKIESLELSKENLQDLGFQFFHDSISLVHPSFDMHYNIGKKQAEMGTIVKNGLEGSEILFPPNPMPVVITNEKGHKINYYGMGKSDDKDFDNTMFDLLIPVKITFDKFIEGRNYSRIFWFYPTDKFVNALPERIKNELKLERDAIINNKPKESGSCTYFEACKSTLQLDDLSIYPNPTNDIVRIDFSLDEAIDGRITLVNISGSVLKVIVPQKTFMSGLNSFESNLSDVSPGIYLISINTENGFKTQRIIVSR